MVTYDDYMATPDPWKKAELVRGEVVMRRPEAMAYGVAITNFLDIWLTYSGERGDVDAPVVPRGARARLLPNIGVRYQLPDDPDQVRALSVGVYTATQGTRTDAYFAALREAYHAEQVLRLAAYLIVESTSAAVLGRRDAHYDAQRAIYFPHQATTLLVYIEEHSTAIGPAFLAPVVAYLTAYRAAGTDAAGRVDRVSPAAPADLEAHAQASYARARPGDSGEEHNAFLEPWPDAFMPEPPTLAIDNVYAADTAAYTHQKVEDLRAAGTRTVWLLYPLHPSVTIVSDARADASYGPGETLPEPAGFPHLVVPVTALFAL